jgi:GH24 family phage-related lysozyme (muramidase)
LDDNPTLSLISKFEGFRPSPYWDVNHLRVGFGSDTVTLPDGSVQPVDKNTTVSVDDAKRDLDRRAQQSQNQIKGAVGSDAWDNLNQNSQAAITSLTYNHGSLPDSLVAPIQSGDKTAIASAVNALGSRNGGQNAGRRAQEASLIDPDGKYAPVSGGKTSMGAAASQMSGQQAPSEPSGLFSSALQKAESPGFVVPALGFLGSMLASQRPTLGGALGEGLLGGVGAYEAQQKQAANTALTQAQANQILPATAAANLALPGQFNIALIKANATRPAGTPPITAAQFAQQLKQSGYTGPLPANIPSSSGVSQGPSLLPAANAPQPSPSVAGPAAASGTQAPAAQAPKAMTPYTADNADEKNNLIIHYSNGVDIPARNDPAYLRAYANKMDMMGDDPYFKPQAEAARNDADKLSAYTYDVNGQRVPVPGALESAQKAAMSANAASNVNDFTNQKIKFANTSGSINNTLDDLEDAFSQFKSGPTAAAVANLQRAINTFDRPTPENPQGKYPQLHNANATNYDKIIKDAASLSLNQLADLPAGAPKATLAKVSAQLAEPNIDADAAHHIIATGKAAMAYQADMYKNYDPAVNGMDPGSYMLQYQNDHPYGEYVKSVEKGMKPAAGTTAAASSAAPSATAPSPSGRTVVRRGTVNSGPNAGKRIVEYSDGTREYQ